MAMEPEVQQQVMESAKYGADGGAVALAVASFLSYLPNVAAVLSVVWLTLRIYETVLNLKDRKARKDEVS